MTGDGRRARRVAETLRIHLSNVIARELADPSLGGVVITGVDLPDDLGLARVHVRLLVGDEDPKRRTAVVRALGRATTRLRRAVAPALQLRRAPELSFDYDTGPDATRRVEELLAEIAKEPKSDE
ncbi:MAG: 30S ribosome-binding factor RbfA [Polyangiaceae bacterium]|nr:30S ribosome-binding factor RbfA [Polyangiaceae bacterium]